MQRTRMKQEVVLLKILFVVSAIGCGEPTPSDSSEVDDTAGEPADAGADSVADVADTVSDTDSTTHPGNEETREQGTDDEDTVCEETCIFPVADHVNLTYVVWAEEDIHYYVPDPAWAMAATQASRMLAYYFSGRIKDTVSPNWFLATALKESFLGCCTDIPPDPEHPSASWKHQSASVHDGCFQIESTTAFLEMQRIFPNHFDGVTHDSAIAGCRMESSALTMAFYDAFAFGIMFKWIDDADEFFSVVEDPQATEIAFSIAYNRGVWSNEFQTAIGACSSAQDMLGCVFQNDQTIARDHAYAISRYVRDLDSAAREGRCYNGILTVQDVTGYVDSISPILTPEGGDELRERAVAAFVDAANGESGPFQSTFGAVLEVLESLPLQDPFPTLDEWYAVPEPEGGYSFSWPDIDETCESVAPVV